MTDTADAGWSPLCPVSALPALLGRSFLHEGRAVAAFRRGEVVHVVSDRCPHNGRTLHDGLLEGCVLTCRWHGWRFDVTTGRSPDVPPGEAGPRLRVYRVRVRNGMVEIQDPGADTAGA